MWYLNVRNPCDFFFTLSSETGFLVKKYTRHSDGVYRTTLLYSLETQIYSKSKLWYENYVLRNVYKHTHFTKVVLYFTGGACL